MKNGFTIIELIISIFILSVAVVGIFSAFTSVTILTSDASNRLTATYLAQEGMEIARNVRDTNWKRIQSGESITWAEGLNDCENGCEMDYITGTGAVGAHVITPWPTKGNYLKIDPSPPSGNGNGFYNYGTGKNSIFKRKMVITPVEDVDGNNSHILKVIVQVSWNQKATILNPLNLAEDCGTSNCIKAEETLYDWFVY
jgi:prepilin-type N-terminal cleavage/methylation domain-containing protein